MPRPRSAQVKLTLHCNYVMIGELMKGSESMIGQS